MVSLGGGVVSYERGTPVQRCLGCKNPSVQRYLVGPEMSGSLCISTRTQSKGAGNLREGVLGQSVVLGHDFVDVRQVEKVFLRELAVGISGFGFRVQGVGFCAPDLKDTPGLCVRD